MQANGTVQVQVHTFLTSALDGYQSSPWRRFLFTPRRISPWYHLDRSLDESQSEYGRCIQPKLLPGIESRFVGYPASTTLTELTRLTDLDIRNLLEHWNALMRGMFLFLCISIIHTRLKCSHNYYKNLTNLHATQQFQRFCSVFDSTEHKIGLPLSRKLEDVWRNCLWHKTCFLRLLFEMFFSLW